MSNLTLEELAESKKLPMEFLQGIGLYDNNRGFNKGVGIPYHGTGSELLGIRTRISMDGDRFRWRTGDKVQLYGLNRLEENKKAGCVFIVEGESDCWTGWYHRLPMLGVPGKSCWRPEWARFISDLDVYIWQEPGAEKFSSSIARDLPHAKVIAAPEGIKDLSEAHIQGKDVCGLIEELKNKAPSVSEIAATERQKQLDVAYADARPVFEANDILGLVRAALQRLGLGGDLKTALILYLVATTRLLHMQRGNMPAHALILAGSSAGKSYYLGSVELLLPPEAIVVMDAGSPTALIHSEAELKHKVLVFSEADSLPAGEDSPGASAFRNLLQDHRLHYDVTERDPVTGRFTTHHIEKEGPTVLITTACRSLGDQLMTRVCVLGVPDDQEQQLQALLTQAKFAKGVVETNCETALLAFQACLQAQAPFDVVVPFAEYLARYLGQQPSEHRIKRDFARLISFIKVHAVLYSHKRQKDNRGRIVAEPTDYEAVYDLVADMFEVSSVGTGKAVRETVKAVEDLFQEYGLLKPITKAAVAKKLDLNKSSAGRRVNTCLKAGWLINDEDNSRKQANLKIGAPLPSSPGLPTPSELEAGIAHASNSQDESENGCTVAPLTGTAGANNIVYEREEEIEDTPSCETDESEEEHRGLLEGFIPFPKQSGEYKR